MPLTEQEQEVQAGYSKWLRRPFSRRMGGAPAFLIFNAAVAVSWRRLGIRPTDRVLDVGCGTGTLLCFLAERAGLQQPAIGIDLTPEQIALAQEVIAARGLTERVIVQTGSALALPFPADSFDLVLSSHVLHNVADEHLPQLLAEVYRVLRPGGRYLTWSFGHHRQWWSDLGTRLANLIVHPPGEVSRNTWPRPYAALAPLFVDAGFTVVQPLILRPWLFPPTPRVGLQAQK